MLAMKSNALIVVWRESDSLDAIAQKAEKLAANNPRGIGVLGISRGAVPLEGAAERQRLARKLDERGVRLLGLASVIEGDGIREVMHRINLVTENPCPLAVFGTVDEAVAWLALRLGNVSPGDLRKAVANLS
jgi:hypothetical protein